MSKRIDVENSECLLVEDRPINDLNVIIDRINEFNPKLVVVDNLQLLPDENEAIKLLRKVSIDNNISVIVFSKIDSLNNNLDFTTLNLEEFIMANPKLELITKKSDKLIVLYHKQDKEYTYRELKNIHGEVRKIDIRKLLD